MELRRVPVYRALNRPFLIAGGERGLMLFLIIFSAAIIFSGLSIATTIIGFFVWVVGTFFLRAMGKRDPIMSGVFKRYYYGYHQKVYKAYSSPFSRGHVSAKSRDYR